MKKIIKSAIVMMLASAFISCTEKDKETSIKTSVPQRLSSKEELVIAMDPRKINGPYDPCTGWGFTGITLVQSKLMEVAPDNSLKGDLAVSYSLSDDRKIWTFRIRNDALFSDGNPVTAYDVAFTYNKSKETGKSVDLTRMENAVAVDKETVEFHLVKPDSTFLYQTAILGIVSEKNYSGDYGLNPVGSGPYKFVSWQQGQQLILERNDLYYGKKSAFKKVVILMMKSDAAYAAAMAGQVDIAAVGENLTQMKIPGFTLQNLDTYGYRLISFPTVKRHIDEESGLEIGNDVTSDVAIREAVAIGIDRTEMVFGALNGIGSEEYDMQSHLPWNIDDLFSDMNNQVEKAKKILDDAGWKLSDKGIREKDGLPAEFNLLYPPSDSGRQALAEVFAVQVRKLGIKVNLKGIELDDMKKNAENKREAVVLGGGAYNPLKMYHMYAKEDVNKKGWDNLALYSDDKVQDYMEKAIAASDDKEANEYWKKALWDGSHGASILGDNPYVTLCFIKHCYFVRDGLSIGHQKIHPHDHNISVLFNLNEWDYE